MTLMTSTQIVETVARALPVASVLVTLVASMAMLMSRGLGRGSAATRHLILAASLVACVAIPVVSATSRVAGTGVAVAARIPTPIADRLMLTEAAPLRRSDGQLTRAPSDLWIVGVGSIWIAGGLVQLLRLAIHMLRARGIARRATRVESRAWLHTLDQARIASGHRGRMELRASSEIDVAIVVGVSRPVVLLPHSSCEWSDRDRYAILVHELAHLARSDPALRIVGHVACAINWFNPVVRAVRSAAEREAELAADDAVLSAGVLPSAYAGLLLSLVEHLRWRAAPVSSTAFARAGTIATRVHAALRENARRTAVGVRAQRAALTVAVTSAVLAGFIQPSPTRPLAGAPVSIVRHARPAVTGTRDDQRNRPTTRATRERTDAIGGGNWRIDAAAALVKALADTSKQVRAAAAGALGDIGEARTRLPLERLLNDPSAEVRIEVRDALSKLGSAARP